MKASTCCFPSTSQGVITGFSFGPAKHGRPGAGRGFLRLPPYSAPQAAITSWRGPALGWYVADKEISREIVNCAVEVHRTLGGPGLLESVYEEALAWELRQAGLPIARQVELPINYKGNQLSVPLRIDLLVGDKVIVECKATDRHNAIFEAQTLTYLRLSGLKLGIVINFGRQLVKNGIHRVVNHL